MTQFEIVNPTETNLNECAKLFVEVYQEPPYTEDWTEADALHYLKRFFEFAPSNNFIAVADSQIEGAIFGYSYPWRKRTNYYIQELFVRREKRNQGIGKALIDYVLKSLGPNMSVSLIANEQSPAAKFYEKFGLSQHKYYKFYSGRFPQKKP